MITASDPLAKTTFECGCTWRWWVGWASRLNHRWERQCATHLAQDRPKECTCLNTGQDDGATTCWQHHDCTLGDCTHGE